MSQEEGGKGGRQRWTVVLPQPIHPKALSRLATRARVLAPDRKKEAFAALASEGVTWGSWEEILAQADGALVRTEPFGAQDMALAPRLKVISRHGVGLDNVDIAEATRRGIAVLYTPGANTLSVAEHAIGLMLALARKILMADRLVRQGRFSQRDGLLGMELHGRTLGVVGFGRIGREVARKAKAAFDMNILVYDPWVDRFDVRDLGEKVDRLEDLLARADVVTVHVPLTPDTRHLLDLNRLQRMKPGSLLLNLSRGHVVDEAALAQVLKEGPLAAAALDVFAEEPPPMDHPLYALDNVILTPHIAAHTEEAMVRMAEEAVDNLLTFLDGGIPESLVNPGVLGPRPS